MADISILPALAENPMIIDPQDKENDNINKN